MNRILRALCVFAVFFSVPAWGEIQLQKIQWQLSKKAKGQASRFEDVDAAVFSGPKLSGKLRARLTLLNRGPKPIEGLLLRYSVAARIAPRERRREAAWAVPFMIEGKRVPKVGPNKVQEVPLDPYMLPIYLFKVTRAGYSPVEIKLQVMIEPRAGETSPLQILESVLTLSP